VRRRHGSGLQFGAAFTYSHAIDDASDFFDTAGSFALPQNSGARSERGSASFDVRLRGAVYFDWPLGGSPLVPRTVRAYRWFSGLRLSGIYTAQSGQPFTVNSAFDVNRDGNLTDRLHSADKLLRNPAEDRRVVLRIAPGTSLCELLYCHAQEDPRSILANGAVGRNTFRADGINNLDLAVSNTIRIKEATQMEVRVEAFNALNRPHFGVPVRILGMPGFGESVSTSVPARTLQFAVKLHF
jgi:hypothetical protein